LLLPPLAKLQGIARKTDFLRRTFVFTARSLGGIHISTNSAVSLAVNPKSTFGAKKSIVLLATP